MATSSWNILITQIYWDELNFRSPRHFVVTESMTCHKTERRKMAADLRRDRQRRFRSLWPPSTPSWPSLRHSCSVEDQELAAPTFLDRFRYETFSCYVLYIRCDVTTTFAPSPSPANCKWDVDSDWCPTTNSGLKSRRVMQNFIHSHHASLWVSLTHPDRATFSNTNQISLDLPARPLINLPPTPAPARFFFLHRETYIWAIFWVSGWI